jgi:hypothetical protein
LWYTADKKEEEPEEPDYDSIGGPFDVQFVPPENRYSSGELIVRMKYVLSNKVAVWRQRSDQDWQNSV